ncbi:MAG: AAA family ATPase [Xanthomonadales bacterium]|nr:AAA family ATPase [Xanthomonadales bacterium]
MPVSAPAAATTAAKDDTDAALGAALHRAIAQVNTLVLGKPREVSLAFACLLAGGHLLIEDLPGLGKTTLAHALAATLGLDFQRMQFTADLLPSDILGVSVYEQDRDGERHGGFRFHPGPVFTQLLLADEINRAPPRTQSALLEAMAEQQVTIDGVCHRLPNPFFVIATQNPVDLAGTFPLPDSQLDRFLLRLQLGYPDADAEREMLSGRDRRDLIADTLPLLGSGEVRELRQRTQRIHASPALVDYVQALVTASREQPGVRVGLSPRAGLALLRAARAMALIDARDFVQPEDVQAVFLEVAAHRLVPQADSGSIDDVRRQQAAAILERVAIP